MKKRGLLLILVLVVLTLLGYTSLRSSMEILRVSDGQVIRFDRLLKEVGAAQIIFIGEYHDRKETHRAQLEIIKKLHKSGAAVVIGMEMFSAANQPTLDRWVAGEMNQKDFVRFFRSEWDMPWPFYRDILVYARDNRIPIVGLNLPREITHKVARSGFDALSPEERRLLPPEVTCSIDPDYRKFIARAYQGHSHGPNSFTYFCEAQMLWNKGMAYHLTDYLKQHPNQLAVVLAGSGHVMKPGMPEEVSKTSKYSYKVIMPDFFDPKIAASESDYVILFNRLMPRLGT